MVATENNCKAYECEAGVWRERRDVSEREASKREIDEGRKELYADTGCDADGFVRKKFVEGGKMKMRTGTKKFVRGD